MQDSLLFVANWKMNLGFSQAIDYAKDNFDDFQRLAQLPNRSLVLCPSFPVLYELVQQFQATNIAIGAQNCSEHEKGSYTGQVSVQSLSDLGCNFCIIGHSEARHYLCETNESVAQKTTLLHKHGITPIICIGESAQDYKKKKTKKVLTDQLEPIFNVISNASTAPIVFAYEPIWSIGTGSIPQKEQLEDIFDFTRRLIATQLPQTPFTLLYGGSVNENNAPSIRTINHVGGFLIGGASLNFQKFKNIVLLGD